MGAVGAAIAGFVSTVGAAVGSSWALSFAARIALSIGFSALSRALAPKPKKPGIKTDATQTGGTDPQAFILGRYATGGQLVAPPMTHGKAGDTPNAFLTYVVAVADLPVAGISRIFIDGEVATIGGASHPDYGTPVAIRGVSDRCWIRWYDGTQTTADPMLIAKYGAHPQRPWAADMIGRGVAYAVLTFRFDRKLYKGLPGVRFEVDGARLYDPRRDPSLGGAGTQSWADPATWAVTDNPVVMIYNILRGITLPGGDTWGGGWAEADLPFDVWTAAMNVCDEPVPLAAGGSEPRYRAGIEVSVDDEPAGVIEELLKTCAGRVTDVGGTMKIAVGPSSVPVLAITDEDVIVTEESTAALFPSLAQTHNGVHATFPDPASLWESRDAPPRYDATAEAEDGRRLIATVALPACPYAGQVQRLMQAWIAEERRFRRHQLVLPPDATLLEPHDVIAWTSARNGYVAKTFEVAEIAHDPVSLLQQVSLREVDATDYDWMPALELPWVPPTPGASLPPAQVVPSFAAAGLALDDAGGAPRRPAILITWDGSGQDDVAALEYEVRLVGATQTISGATLDVAAGSHVIAAGILPGATYEVRARFNAPRPVAWTAWATAITPATTFAPQDFGVDIGQFFTDAGLAIPRIVTSLPADNAAGDELVWLSEDGRLYRWDAGAGAWTARILPGDIPPEAIEASQIVSGTIVTGLLAAAAVKSANIEIDDNLVLSAAGAGFQMGKASAADLDAGGIYMGRTLEPGGGTGFGFCLGQTSGGVRRYLQGTTADGLLVVNARFRQDRTLAAAPVALTTSQTWAVPAGTVSVTLELMGTGGGGSAGTSQQNGNDYSAGYNGTNGAPTTVALYDGASPTGQSWTVPGGAGATSYKSRGSSSPGQASLWGAGGLRGTDTVAAGDGQGFGSGGGGGGWRVIIAGGSVSVPTYGYTKGGLGGGASALVTIPDLDLSGLAAPRLVVTIGAPGQGGVNPTYPALNGGDGAPGRVLVTLQQAQLIPAAPVPQLATFSGQFAKASGATGNTIFPDFGPGIWVIWEDGGAPLDIGQVTIDSQGTSMHLQNPRSATFVADIRPVITVGAGNNRTIRYMFYGID